MSRVAANPVIVGVDGSDQAEGAALWAVDEALRRDVPLRLVYVIRTDVTRRLTADEYRSALDDAKKALNSVRLAIGRTGRSIEVRTSIAQGSPSGVLLAESSDAEMLCVGASGMGRIGRAMLGSTAASVAEHAECSVVIAPSGDIEGQDTETPWVVVPVNGGVEPDADVIETAVAEARLRSWPMLAVGVRRRGQEPTPHDTLDGVVSHWRQRFPDIHIYPVSTNSELCRFLDTNPGIGGLVVLDESSAEDAAAIVGPEHRRGSQTAGRAVVIVRHRASWHLAEAGSARC